MFAFYQELWDRICLLWVDAELLDGDESAIQWASDDLDARFDCKDLEWLEPNGPKLDYLGMEISQDDNYTYMSMCQYIANCIGTVSELLGIPSSKFTPCTTPMIEQIDCTSARLCPEAASHFMTFCGFIGWLQLTMRVDVCFFYSRVTQHLQSPNESAMSSCIRAFRYLKCNINLCLAAPRYTTDMNVSEVLNPRCLSEQHYMAFHCDSDHAGNTEPQNKRKKQYDYVALENSAPVDWHSKSTSVAFAHPALEGSHADTSSAAGEIYGAGNAVSEMLQLGYIADEVNIPFPKPAFLDMDNAAAEAFTNNTTIRTKLKHIDVRQEWVRCLRDKDIIVPRHVSSQDNLADFFTKILPPHTFIRLRGELMRELPPHLQYHFAKDD
jgi:hypothetical protein